MTDNRDDLAIQALYRERVEGHGLTSRSLEDSARELGLDPEELFSVETEAPADDRT